MKISVLRISTMVLVVLLAVLLSACPPPGPGPDGGGNGGMDNGNGGVPSTTAGLPEAPNAMNAAGDKQGVWRENETSTTTSQGRYENGNKEGVWLVYQTGGSNDYLLRIEPHKNGLLHGERKRYRKGELLQITNYANGQRNGTDTQYYLAARLKNVQTVPSGARDGDRVIQWKYTYEADVLNGPFDDFFLIGDHINILNERLMYENGLKTSGSYQLYFSYYRGGPIINARHIPNYVAGKRHGMWDSDEAVYSSEGVQSRLNIQGDFHEGNRVGLWTVRRNSTVVRTYDCGESNDLSRGNNPGPFPPQYPGQRPAFGDRSNTISGPAGIVRITNILNSVTESVDPRCTLNSDAMGKQGMWQEIVGRERQEGRYVNDQKQGEWKWYLTDNTEALSRKVNYSNGARHGQETIYRSGAILHIIPWSAGMRNGVEKRYFDPPDQATVRILTTWNMGVRHGQYTLQLKRSDNGNIETAHTGVYTNGKKTGSWDEGKIEPNGTVNPSESGMYNMQGQRTGEWILIQGGVISGYTCNGSSVASERLADDTGCTRDM